MIFYESKELTMNKICFKRKFKLGIKDEVRKRC